MTTRYEFNAGDNNCDLCKLIADPNGEWVAYEDYLRIERLYLELVDGINALGFPSAIARIEYSE